MLCALEDNLCSHLMQTLTSHDGTSLKIHGTLNVLQLVNVSFFFN